MSISFLRKGRTGNNLYQYFVTRILADIYKLNSSNEFRSPVLHFTDHTRYDTIINRETLVVTDDNIYDVIENHDKYRNRNFLLEGFFQDSGFFNDNYHNILSYLKLDNIKKNCDDIVMHIRLNDFNREGSKSCVIDPSWYLEILQMESFRKLYIVIDTWGRKKYRKEESEKNYINYFNKYVPIIISNREMEDFHYIRKFDKIICSNSTFSWWAAFLSDASRIYTPSNWRGKKKLWNIRDISITSDNKSCDINRLVGTNLNDINRLVGTNLNDINNLISINNNNNIDNDNILMRERCVVLVSNNKYFFKAKNTIKDIRNIGEYNGDLVFVYGDDISKNQLEELQTYHVIPKYFKDIDLREVLNKLNTRPYKGLDRKLGKMFCFHKFYLFDLYFKKWRKIFYLDCGMNIYKPIEPFFHINCDNKVLANSDSQPKYKWKLNIQFNQNSYPEIYQKLSQNFELNIDYFQSTILVYDTNIIEYDTFDRLRNLLYEYPIGMTNDQAIMNLLFNCQLKIWEQVPLKRKNNYLYDYKTRRKRTRGDYIMLKI